MDGYNLIKEYIAKNKEIVIFCGAGTSVPLGLPDWKSLCELLINTIANKYQVPKIKNILPALESDLVQVIDALEHISDKTYFQTVLEELRKNITINSVNFTVHEAILNLSKEIITTNYDLAFETFSKNAIQKLLPTDDFELANLSKSNEYLFKIHGDIAKPTSCILFKKQYEDLYNNKITNYFLEMAKIFSDKILLFIGFSLSDPYINHLFDVVDKAYQGFGNKHFIVTTRPEDFINFRNYILPIQIESHSKLPSLLNELSEYKKSFEKITEEKNEITDPLETAKFKILAPKPIDKNVDFNRELIISAFANFNISLTDSYFNIEKLNEIEDCDYYFIFTQLVKGQILIEDEGLRYKLIKITELNILASNENLKAVFLFIDNSTFESIDTILQLDDLVIPIVVVPIDILKCKDVLNSLTYKAFVKADISMLKASFSIINENLISLRKLKKGNFQRHKVNTFISKFIDKKNFLKFVGRKSDQENIARKILANRYENKLLSIKGSGGIGKTTIISKLGIELAERGYFDKGVYFVTCNPIQSFENFEFEISQCFNLTSSKLLRDQIQDTVFVKDRILILDNLETLLYLKDRDKILDLISFLCDYSVVVVTTRQILELDFEEVYELRNLTSDEAVVLFKELYPIKVDEKEEKVLRREILEKLLNNNPLAIKLIVKGLPASKHLETLKKELESNIFNEDDIDQIFEKGEDYNIERSASLYHSINYSYINLSVNEKLAFELLSLFPDGMHMENFKTFCKSSKDKNISIGDREIKLLDNKSLLENSNGFLKLQSIISRFSDYKFKTRSEDERLHYYDTAYSYNRFFVDLLTTNSALHGSVGLKILDLNTNNYLKCLEYLTILDKPTDEKIKFISQVSNIFRDTNQPNELLKSLGNHDFGFDEEAKKVIDLLENHVIYWTKNFDEPFEYVKEHYPFEVISKLDYSSIIGKITFDRLTAIYRTEGYDYDVLKLLIDKGITENNTADIFFKLGYHAEAALLVPANNADKTYFDFEIELANDQLNPEALTRYMTNLYKKESLEMTQMTFLKSKIMEVSNDEIKKLVISNPYTKGLINFMYAKNEFDLDSKINFYLLAKESLFNVKYHYVECILQFMVEMKHHITVEEYQHNWEEAFTISKKFHFRKFLFDLNSLRNADDNTTYDYNFNPIPIDKEIIKRFITDHININKAYFKKPVKIQKNVLSLTTIFS